MQVDAREMEGNKLFGGKKIWLFEDYFEAFFM